MITYLEALPKVATRKYGRFIYPFLDIWHKGQRTRLHIGCKVLVGQWCKEKQRAFVSPLLSPIDNRNNMLANEQIDAFITRYMAFIDYLCHADKLENFTFELSKYMARPRKQHVEKIDVFKIINDAVINSSSISKGTQENYLKGIKALKAFSDFRERQIDSFEMITADLIYEFVEFLGNGHYLNKGKPYAMASLNSIIRYAVSAIKCAPTCYLSKAHAQLIPQPNLTDKTSKDNEIALRDYEVIKLWQYNPTTKNDEEIRDMFLLLCLTGQRVDDLKKIDGGYVIEKGIPYLQIVQEKCSHKLKIDIVFPIAIEILKKYDHLPIVNIKRRINNNIGRIAKEAGICGQEQVSKHYVGNDKPTVKEVERTSLIHTHTGRRTFVTVLTIHEWNYVRIGKYTGQSPEIVALYDKSTSIDRRIFDQLQPNERLEVVGENKMQPQQPSVYQQTHVSSPQLTSLPNSIDEAKRVLNFLGVDTDDYMEVDNLDTLLRFIALREGEIVNGFHGEKLDKIKEIFNEDAPIKERKQHLHNLITFWNAETPIRLLE